MWSLSGNVKVLKWKFLFLTIGIITNFGEYVNSLTVILERDAEMLMEDIVQFLGLASR